MAVPPDPTLDPNVEQSTYWPEPVLLEMIDLGARTDRSLSNLAQLAWTTAQDQIEASDYDQLAAAIRAHAAALGPDPDRIKRKQTLVLSTTVLAAVQAQAARLDASLSFVLQSAVALARSSITGLPTVTTPLRT